MTEDIGGTNSTKKLAQIILFGDSLTQWSFDDETQGFGWYLSRCYKGKAEIVNEGTISFYHCFTTHTTLFNFQ